MVSETETLFQQPAQPEAIRFPKIPTSNHQRINYPHAMGTNNIPNMIIKRLVAISICSQAPNPRGPPEKRNNQPSYNSVEVSNKTNTEQVYVQLQDPAPHDLLYENVLASGMNISLGYRSGRSFCSMVRMTRVREYSDRVRPKVIQSISRLRS